MPDIAKAIFKKKITLKILVFLLATDILETVTQYFFKKTALGAGIIEPRVFSDVFIFLRTAFFSPYLWLGILSVVITFTIWSTILSKIDLSVAVPIASFSYILVPLVSIFVLHEQVSFLRWIGICIILAGVIFVSLSSKEKEFLP